MCYKPITLKKNQVVVPCGRCPKCIGRKVSAWSFRLMQEEKTSSSAYFLTLTYDSKFIPIDSKGRLCLHKRDLQLFFKRLRKAQCGNGLSNIKYYAVGEYGGRTKRPHYHVILFNAKLELINDAWNLGHIHYGQVSGASVGYTLKYMSKQKPKKNDDLQREFAVMSKGLGIGYLDETMCNYHADDLINRCYCTLKGGVKIPMPRYYKDKLYFHQERLNIAEVYAIQAQDIMLEKLSKQTAKDFRNEMLAIDAAYDRMYRSSLKTVI